MNNNKICHQMATLDDADIWVQQLVTTNQGGDTTTSTNDDDDNQNNTDDDSNNTNTNTTIQQIHTIAYALQELEGYICCSHCTNIYHVPVIVQPCYHIFCSYCIRMKFHYDSNTHSMNKKPSCPICNTIVNTAGKIQYEKCIQSYHLLDTLVHVYRKIRQPLLHQLVEYRQSVMESMASSSVNGIQLLQAIRNANQMIERMVQGVNTTITEMIHHPNSSSMNDDNLSNDTIIQTILSPICYYAGNIPYPTLIKPLVQSLPILPKIIYTGKTKKQMIELLQHIGISKQVLQVIASVSSSTTSTNTTTHHHDMSNSSSTSISIMKKIHFQYMTLYNAECDSLRPRSSKQLLSIIEQQQLAIYSNTTTFPITTTTIKNNNNSLDVSNRNRLGSSTSNSSSCNTTVSLSKQQQLSKSTTIKTTTNQYHHPTFQQWVTALKMQRKILGEASSCISDTILYNNHTNYHTNHSTTTKQQHNNNNNKYWNHITTGYHDYDMELSNNYMLLIQQYYQKFPNEYIKQQQRIQQYKQQQQKIESMNCLNTHSEITDTNIMNDEINSIHHDAITTASATTATAISTNIDDTCTKNVSDDPPPPPTSNQTLSINTTTGHMMHQQNIVQHRNPYLRKSNHHTVPLIQQQNPDPATNDVRHDTKFLRKIESTTNDISTNSNRMSTTIMHDNKNSNNNITSPKTLSTLYHSAFSTPTTIEQGTTKQKSISTSHERETDQTIVTSSTTHTENDTKTLGSFQTLLSRYPQLSNVYTPKSIRSCGQSTIQTLSITNSITILGDTNTPSSQNVNQQSNDETTIDDTTSSCSVSNASIVTTDVEAPKSLHMIQKQQPIQNIQQSTKRKIDKTNVDRKTTTPIVIIDHTSIIGPWVCTYCTYMNTRNRSTRALCEMCMNQRTTIKVPKLSNPKDITTPNGSNESSSSSNTTTIQIDC